MHCAICKVGRIAPGRTTVTFDDDEGYTVVIRHVPAEVCDNCGEAYVDESTARALLERARLPQGPGSGLLVVDYAA